MSNIRESYVPKVVIIGGGTGTFMVLTALKNFPVNLTAVVSMADNGGSTGRLRDQYGVLPPGDIRRSLIALSEAPEILRTLFSYRFDSGDFAGHSFGNLFLSVLEKTTGSFNEAVKEVARVLNIRGRVIPVTLDNVQLFARLADGSVIKGEADIDVPKHDPAIPINKIWLKPRAKINPEAGRAIIGADTIVIGPGDLFTSVVPNFLVDGLASAVRRSRALKIYICNLMTKVGETNNFKGSNFVETMEKFLGKGVLDLVIFNNKKPMAKFLRKYAAEGSLFVEPPRENQNGKTRYVKADLLDAGPLIRHNPKKKLGPLLMKLLRKQ